MNTPLRALIIEDSEVDWQLLRNHLTRGGYEVTSERVETPEAMNTVLDRGGWDIIISDHRMPQFSSLAALKLCKERGCDLPFIVVSGSIGEELAVTAMRAGAHDYIMKDNLTRLVPAVARELREAETRRQCRRAEQALEHSHHRTELILEAAGEGICGLDGNGIITFINPRGANLLGWKTEELVGKSLHEIVHHAWDDQTPVARQDCSLCATLSDGQPHGMDGEIFWRKDRSAFPIEYVSTPLRDGDETMGAVLTFRDITVRKGAEAALLDSNRGLKRVVRKLRQRQQQIVQYGGRSKYEEIVATDEHEPAPANPSSLVTH
jgi:PAS domain S-box-containing protein